MTVIASTVAAPPRVMALIEISQVCLLKFLTYEWWSVSPSQALEMITDGQK